MQGRYAGCSRPFRAGLTLHKLFVHALHVQGRPHRPLGAAAAFWHATMRGQARVAAVHHGPRPCGLTGQQAGQASAAQAVGARAWTGPSGPRGTLRRPASGHMRPCERAAATPEAERWRTAANGLTTAVRSRFASRQCTLLHEQDPRDRAVWSAACSSCHPGQLAWLLFNCGAHVCCF